MSLAVPEKYEEDTWDFVSVPTSTKQADGIMKPGLTEPMYRAFWDAFDEAYKHRGHKESTAIAYEAMLAHAPKNQQEMRNQSKGIGWHPLATGVQ